MGVFVALWAVAALASGAEESSLLQVEVDSSQESAFAIQNIGQQIAALHIPGRANQLAINSMMKTLAKSNRLDEDSRATLVNVSELLKDPILLSLAAFKGTKDGELAQVNVDVANCNTNGVDADNSLLTSSNGARDDHADCRAELFTALDGEEEACSTALAIMQVLKAEVNRLCNLPLQDNEHAGFHDVNSPEPRIWDTAQADKKDHWDKIEVNYLDRLQTLKSEYDMVDPQKIQDCLDLTAAAASKMEECTQDQDTFETKFCSFRVSRTLLCSTRNECYNNATTDHNNRWAEISALGNTRAKEACLIMHVICLIDNLIVNGTTDLNGCDHVGLDSAQCDAEYNNVEPTIPAKEACDTSLVSVYPGHPDWYSHEYSKNPDNVLQDWTATMAQADLVIDANCP